MRVYLMTDLEGVAGVWDWDAHASDDPGRHAEQSRMRRLLTGEVNAAIEGFYDAGATEVIVNDGHGAGYTIEIEGVDPRAQVIHGDDRPFWLPLLDARCDATALVGAHAKAHTHGANLCHTMDHRSVRGYWINGISLGEIGLQALIAGHYGVPFVFLSGDQYACEEVSALIPGVRTVATKKGLSLRSACTLAPSEARNRIREGARESLGLLGQVKPLTLDRPLTFREERNGPDFDTTSAPPVGRIIDSHTREIVVADVIELLCVLHGYEVTRAH